MASLDCTTRPVTKQKNQQKHTKNTEKHGLHYLMWFRPIWRNLHVTIFSLLTIKNYKSLSLRYSVVIDFVDIAKTTVAISTLESCTYINYRSVGVRTSMVGLPCFQDKMTWANVYNFKIKKQDLNAFINCYQQLEGMWI